MVTTDQLAKGSIRLACRFGYPSARFPADIVTDRSLTVCGRPHTLTTRISAKTVPGTSLVSHPRYQWARPGDVNAFFGLMLDNIADLSMTVGLLGVVFEFPTEFALRNLVPGTAVGVLVGDLLFFWLAFRLARRTGRGDVTAMPLGLDTPSTFGMVLFVLGPAFISAQKDRGLEVEAAARYAWHIGIWSLVWSGLFKLACAFGAGWVRKILPRAGLLGSLTAIALVLISFLPLVELMHEPVVGLTSLAIIVTTLVARIPMPGRVPGALGAVLVGGTLYYVLKACGWLSPEHLESAPPVTVLFPADWLNAWTFEWFAELRDSLIYLPIVLPFALGTVVGGIDCTESAAAAGDEYDTGQVIGVEACATLVAALCGGVIQTTPYIGQPAYKALGGRAAYTLATALFVGSAGLIGYFGYLYAIIPKSTVFPILVFVGLEITAQSFHATPRRHFPAVALACVPALASLAIIYVDKLIGALVPAGTTPVLGAALQLEVNTIRVLANGFVLTSLLWGSWLAALIDQRLRLGATYAAVAGVGSLFGLIHSPLPGSPLFLPWNLPEGAGRTPFVYSAGYLLVAALLWGWSWLVPTTPLDADDDSPAAESAPAESVS